MSIADVLIIYLAAGTPFGVYSLLDLRGDLKLGSLFSITRKYLLWPYYAALGIYRYFWNTNVDLADITATLFERSIIDIRAELKSTLPLGSQRTELRRILDAFDTYTGLAEMTVYPATCGHSKAPAILEPVDHPAPHIAARCQERHNRLMLVSHRDRAERELRALVLMSQKKLSSTARLQQLVNRTVDLFAEAACNHHSQPEVYASDGVLTAA